MFVASQAYVRLRKDSDLMFASRPMRATSNADFLKLREIAAERIGRNWCLFLDRDGVINRRVVDDYVRSWDQFAWLPGARSALAHLAGWAPYLVVVTNQQGIGKGLMTGADVATIHGRLQTELAADRDTIAAFQVCPHLESESCRCRKPQPGLVLDWLSRHPEVDPKLSIVAGDSLSDLELAHNVRAAVGGCAAIMIGSGDPDGLADASFDTLSGFAAAVANSMEGRNL